MTFERRDRALAKGPLVAELLPATQTTLYTTPATTRTELEFANVALEEDNKVSLWIVPNGFTVQDKYRIWWDVKFFKEISYIELLSYLLQPGDYIVAQAENANEVAIRIEGVEVGL